MKTQMNIPQHILHILNILWSHNAEAFLVGGCVRDMLMHRTLHDYDITTSALPNVMMNWFIKEGKHVIPTGIQHGTITVIYQQEQIEITTYRHETSYRNHRTPEDVQFTTSLIEDLQRRDFTMNAIAYAPTHGMIDPYCGFKDIQAGKLCCVGNPIERFNEDALRILRALRFACTLRFNIEDSTWNAIQTLHHDLRYVSSERKRDEFNRILLSNYPNTLQFLREANVLCELLPEYDIIYDYPQPTKWHMYDIFKHTDIALNHTSHLSLEAKLAIVLHDVGKVQCATFDSDGTIHFKGHAKVSTQLAKKYLKRLHYDNATIQRVCTLIHYHDYYVLPKKALLRKYLSKFDNDIDFAFEALDVQIADNHGKHPNIAQQLIDNVDKCKAMILDMEKENDIIAKRDLQINGHDVMKLGFQGKEIGDALQYIYERVIYDPSLNQRESLMDMLTQYKESVKE